MKVKIREVEIPLPRFSDEKYKKMYICKYKFHWWQSWKYIKDPRTKVPELFESPKDVNNKLESLGFELR